MKPTAKPTAAPTATSTVKPTAVPTATPTVKPTATPTSIQQNNEDSNHHMTENTTIEPTIQPQMPTAQPQETPVSETSATEPLQESVTQNIVAVTPKPQTAVDERPTVEMDMEKTTRIYGDTLKMIREKGIDAVLTMNPDITWTIYGTSIDENEVQDVDLNVTFGNSEIPKEMIEILAEQEEFIELSLAHDGDFGFTATLTLRLDKGRPGEYANLYYYNEQEKCFEFQCASEINVANKASFKFEHASDYVIIISKETKSNLVEKHYAEFEKIRQQDEAVPVMETAPLQAEELPTKEPKKALGYLTLIILGSIALGIAIYLIAKGREDKS